MMLTAMERRILRVILVVASYIEIMSFSFLILLYYKSMSYISLLHEGEAGSNSSFLAATDFWTVGRALTNYGILTQLDDATFSGANGITYTSLISTGNVSASQLQIATDKFFTSVKAQTDAKVSISATDST